MNMFVVIPLILTIILVSSLAWLFAGDVVILLFRRLGERRAQRILASVLLLAVAAAAAATWWFANRAREQNQAVAPLPAVAPATAMPGGDLAAMSARLAQRLEREPDDAQGWALYARTQMELKQYAGASRAYARAIAMLPADGILQIEFADAEVMANKQQWTQPAADAIAVAVRLLPEHPEALWLAGSERFARKDYGGALRHWEKLARIAPPDSEYAKEMATAVVEARALRDGLDPAAALAKAGVMPPATAPAPATGVPDNAANKAALASDLRAALLAFEQRPANGAGASVTGVKGRITLEPSLQGRISPDDTVFVFARSADKAAGQMPLAAARYRAAELPIQFELSDNNAMSPTNLLSSARAVVVTARISRSADPSARRGDLEGISEPVNIGAGNVSILINRPRQ